MERLDLRNPRKDLRNLHNPALNALFPKTRQDVLAATLLDPNRAWYLSDLARHLGSQPSSLQRELAGLVAAGILRRSVDGNRVYFQADADCPCLGELRALMMKSSGTDS